MAHKSPSGHRRDGRNTFIPEQNPFDYFQYKRSDLYGDMFNSFLEGWNEAKANYEKRIEEEENKPTLDEWDWIKPNQKMEALKNEIESLREILESHNLI